jgi:hypothetical protein
MDSPGLPRYAVTIHYREPSREQRSCPRPAPFRWTFAVEASTQEEAIAAARRVFRDTERSSGAGWGREIILIDAQLAPVEPSRPL